MDPVTAPVTAPAAVRVGVFDLDGGWALHPQVAVRPEPFGALLYHFGTRRLSFLKDPALRRIAESLAEHPSARSACAAAGVSAPSGAVIAALATLESTGMIVRRPRP